MTRAAQPSLQALADLTALLKGATLIDLTVTLEEGHPCSWPGSMHFEHKVWNWYTEEPEAAQPLRSNGPYYTCWMTLDEHTGTHFDAPPHFVPPPGSGIVHESKLGRAYGDRVALPSLQGRAAVVDVSSLTHDSGPGVSPLITPDHLAAWESEHGAFTGDDIVLLRSGWDRNYLPFPAGSRYTYDPLVLRSRPGWPSPTAEAVEYLFDRDIRTLGTDSPSIGASHDPITAHYAGLERGMVYIEALANLGRLPPRGAYFLFLPIKIARSSGGPGRAIAWLFIAGDAA